MHTDLYSISRYNIFLRIVFFLSHFFHLILQIDTRCNSTVSANFSLLKLTTSGFHTLIYYTISLKQMLKERDYYQYRYLPFLTLFSFFLETTYVQLQTLLRMRLAGS